MPRALATATRTATAATRIATRFCAPRVRLLSASQEGGKKSWIQRDHFPGEAKLREHSEQLWKERQSQLRKDFDARQDKIDAWRDVIRNDVKIPHPPPARLYSAQRAFSFPPLQTSRLDGQPARLAADGLFASRLTLLGVSGSRFSEAMVEGWLQGVQSAVAELPALQMLRLSLVDGGVLTWLQRPLLWSLKFGVPAERRDSFFCHFGDADGLRRQLRMENRFLGYVCVIDSMGIVRWHVHSSEAPTEDEVRSLAALLPEALAGAPRARGGGAEKQARATH